MITLLALRRFLLKELKLILTYLYLGEALQCYLLVNKDKQGVGAVNKVLKAIKLKEVLGV